MAFLQSVLKGLRCSPRILTDPSTWRLPGVLTAADIFCLVIPEGVLGLPVFAALEQGIPVIAVRENLYVDSIHYTAPFSSEIALGILRFLGDRRFVPCA